MRRPYTVGGKMAEDRIILQGMVFFGYHGVNPEERTLGQRFEVDLEMEMDLAAAGLSDDLSRTVNYASAYKLAREVVEGQPYNLIEAVAERLASAMLSRFPVEGVRVRLRKPWAPIKGSVLDSVAVEIVRKR
ncbi:MAG TPA: dihydroneopterin aldolase [Chloroflexota bacterium]|nr:dihydroneopterin aldolase [Chloroflexota bacterium]